MGETIDAFQMLAAGDIAGIRRAIQQNPSTARARDESGVSLLMQALYRGQRDLAKEIAANRQSDIFEAAALGLLDNLKESCRDQSQAEAFSADGFTSLHFACYFGQPEAARFLIESGADVDAVAQNPTKVRPLHSAVSARNFEASRLLLEHGAAVNARQQGGWAPIHAAAQNGDRALVELLLQHGANPDAANDEGKTAENMAKEKGHLEVLKMLGDAKSR